MAYDAVSNTVGEIREGSSPFFSTKEIVDIFFVSNNSVNVTKQAFTTGGCEFLPCTITRENYAIKTIGE